MAGIFNRLPESFRGGAMLACGISILGVTDNMTKMVSDFAGVGQFHFSRSVWAVAILVIVGMLMRTRLMPVVWWAVALRTLFLTLAMMLFFSVLPMMPLAEAGAGLFTSPIFVLLFSRVFYGERIGPGRILAVLVGSIGVLLVLKPGAAGFSYYLLLPTLAGAFYALNSMVTYRYCAQESSLSMTLVYFLAIGVGGAFFTGALTAFPVPAELFAQAPFLFMGWAGVDAYYWAVIIAIASGGMLAIILITIAYQTVSTSYAIVYEYVYLIAAGLSGWAMWGDVPDRWSVLGILCIIAAGLIITRAQRAALRSVSGDHE